MKYITVFLALQLSLIACSIVQPKKNLTFELARSIKVGASQNDIQALLGSPDKQYDLSKYDEKKTGHIWHYLGRTNDKRFRIAISFDPKRKLVNKISWGVTPEDKRSTLSDFKELFVGTSFKKKEHWRGPHNGRSLITYLSADKKIEIIMSGLTNHVDYVIFR